MYTTHEIMMMVEDYGNVCSIASVRTMKADMTKDSLEIAIGKLTLHSEVLERQNKILHEAYVSSKKENRDLMKQPHKQPLTRDQREKVFNDASERMEKEWSLSWDNALINAVEAYHGIK